jgi:hypothetical protein
VRRKYEILWNDKPAGEPRYVRVREPADAPAATHWVWWGRGYLSCNPDNVGEWLPCDQTAEIPVRRLQ